MALPRVVFMGSPEFAVPALRCLAAGVAEVALVVSQPDRPAGRGGALRMPAVKQAALDLGLDVIQPDSLKDEAVHESLRAAQPDAFVVAAYGKILPRAVLHIPSRGALNIHASLLPRWRGASPVAAAILAGDPETGVSLMEMALKMDAGPVIARRSIAIKPGDTTGTLEPRLADLGAELLGEHFGAWLDGAPAVPQDESQVTYCRLLGKDDGHLARSVTAVEAERVVRAYDPWPGAFVSYSGERLAVWKARVLPGDPGEPGALTILEKLPAIAFKDGWLLLEEVQRPGGKRVAGSAFLNGERGRLEPTVVLRD